MEKTEKALKKGYMVKSPPSGSKMKKWKLRWFVFCEVYYKNPGNIIKDHKLLLYYFEDYKSEKESKLPKGVINIMECKDIVWRTSSLSGFDHIFSVECPDRKYHLSAENCVERNNWISLLRRYRFGENDVVVLDLQHISQGVFKELSQSPKSNCVAKAGRRNTCYVKGSEPLVSEGRPRGCSLNSIKSDSVLLDIKADNLVQLYHDRKSASYSGVPGSSISDPLYERRPDETPLLPPRPISTSSVPSEDFPDVTSQRKYRSQSLPSRVEAMSSMRAFAKCDKCQCNRDNPDGKSQKSVKRRQSYKYKPQFPPICDDLTPDETNGNKVPYTEDPGYVDMTYADKIKASKNKTISNDDSTPEDTSECSTPKGDKDAESSAEPVNNVWVRAMQAKLLSLNVNNTDEEDMYVEMHNPEQKNGVKKNEPVYEKIPGDIPPVIASEKVPSNDSITEKDIEESRLQNTRILYRKGTDIIITEI